MKIFIWWRDLQFLHFDEFLEAQDQLFDSSPRTPQELRIATIFKPIISMSWKFSGRLYLKSVQTCDKSVGPLSWTLLFGVLAWKIRPVSDSIIFWGQSWRYLDYWKIFTNSLRVELHSIFWHSIMLEKVSSSMDLERHLHQRHISQGLQWWISWIRSTQIWPYLEILCSFWYF